MLRVSQVGGRGGGPLLGTGAQICFFFNEPSLRERFKKSITLQTSSEQGSENYPMCLNPIFYFLNMTFKHKLYINMVKFYFCFLFKGLF